MVDSVLEVRDVVPVWVGGGEIGYEGLFHLVDLVLEGGDGRIVLFELVLGFGGFLEGFLFVFVGEAGLVCVGVLKSCVGVFEGVVGGLEIGVCVL